MAGVNQGDINLFMCLPLMHFIGNEKSNCLEYSFMNTVGFMFESFNQSVRVRDSFSKRALKKFLLTFVRQNFITKEHRSENDAINH